MFYKRSRMKPFSRCGLKFLLSKKKSVIRCILYRQHNSPKRFQQYFDKTIENLNYSGKHVVIMGDFNIDLLK